MKSPACACAANQTIDFGAKPLGVGVVAAGLGQEGVAPGGFPLERGVEELLDPRPALSVHRPHLAYAHHLVGRGFSLAREFT